MKNNLEYFIKSEREEFDEAIPPERVWEEIARKRKNRRGILYSLSISQIAASVILMLSGIAIILLMQVNSDKQQRQRAEMVAAPVEEVDNTYQYDIRHMTHVIEIKASELKEISKTDPQLYKNFQTALDQLNSYYAILQKELKGNPNKEQLLDAMIQNLKLQQELLNQQLSIYQNLKHSKNEKFNKNI